MKNRSKAAGDQKMRKPLSLRMQRRLHEGWFLICLTCALFLFIALVTYHVNDPGWSSSGLSLHAANSGGRVGAWLADVMLSLLGIMAYFFPPLMILASWIKLKERNEQTARPLRDRFMKGLGWVCILLGGAALANFYLTFKLPLPAASGGIVGDVVGSGLAVLFNQLGSTLLLITLLLCGITLVTGLSWLGLMARISEHLLLRVNTVPQRIKTAARHLMSTLTNKVAVLVRSSQKKSALPTAVTQKESTSSVIRSEPKLDLASRVESSVPLSKTPASAPLVVNKLTPQIVDHAPDNLDQLSQSIATSYRDGPLPDLKLLNAPQAREETPFADISFEALSQLVEQRLADFGVEVSVVAVHPGPVITRFELALAPGVKVSKITGLAKDIARSLSTVSVRIVEVIPGKSVIGLEIPNENRELVTLRAILESTRFVEARSPMTLVLGKDIAGHSVVVDLAKMPHLLVAGTTGSGKSVSLNAMLLSMLYKATPAELRFIMIDPKMLELSIYDGIPHLLTPVITDMKNAANALRWCVAEMDKRYRLMAALGVRNLASYNQQVNEAIKQGSPLPMPGVLVTDAESAKAHLTPLPMIAVIVDELADMMMVVGKKVEDLIARIAQKARAAGIHLILATQRPSVDVITGLIKANIPTRIAFQVSSRIDSRTILDQQGAEQLLGHGDMLYLPPGAGVPTRVHGAYVADEEVHRVVKAWRSAGQPVYIDEVTDDNDDTVTNNDSVNGGEQDALYDEAVRIVTETRRASISLVQRRLRIGYNRAARMIEEMEARGIVSGMDNNGSREVLANEVMN